MLMAKVDGHCPMYEAKTDYKELAEIITTYKSIAGVHVAQ